MENRSEQNLGDTGQRSEQNFSSGPAGKSDGNGANSPRREQVHASGSSANSINSRNNAENLANSSASAVANSSNDSSKESLSQQAEHRKEIEQVLEKSALSSFLPAKRRGLNEFLRYAAALLLIFACLFALVYYASRPKTYDLKVSDISPFDISAPRSVEDREATKKRALEEQMSIKAKVYRSDEISADSVNKIKTFCNLFREKREQLYYSPADRAKREAVRKEREQVLKTPDNVADELPGVRKKPTEQEAASITTSAVSEISQNFQQNFELKDARNILIMPDDRFENFCSLLEFSAENIMHMALDKKALKAAIVSNEEKNLETNDYYEEDVYMVTTVLSSFLQPNVKFNEEATMNARKDAYDRVMNNPIMINRGSRIVSKGDVIDDRIYNLLKALDLTSAGDFDYRGFFGQMAYVFIIVLIGFFYIYFRQMHVLKNPGLLISFLLAIFVPLLISLYMGRLTPLGIPVYFATVILCTYFGFETSMTISMLLMALILPIVNFNVGFFFTAGTGIVVTALFARGITGPNSFAKLIMFTTLSNALSSFTYGLLQHDFWSIIGVDVMAAVIAAAVSIIAAIGMMPIFELLHNSVSPLRLIELAQPGHALMKRLFIEAPGTSQHSMMVANLADTAAAAIGANAMLCRVGAYYHDIGKLRNPGMFTENQGSENPHDYMSPEESAEIIIRHTTDGVGYGKQYRLPQPILNIIAEHHGTTVLQYFYHKACKIAEEQGLPKPPEDDYRYPGPVPSSRESGVVMLADSTEAAMKSTGTKDLVAAEKLMRRVFKIKNDQDQLVRTGLSFGETEVILQAFLQVYAGQLHDRIKYPDDNKNSN